MFVSGTSLFVLLFLVALAFPASLLIAKANRLRSTLPEHPENNLNSALFLFRAGALVDANSAALQICAQTPVEEFDWSALRQYLSRTFPDFPQTQGAFHKRDLTVLRSDDPSDGSIVTVDQWNDVARVTLSIDPARDTARRTAILQAIFQAPNPIWKSNPTGEVVWRNAAYKSLVSTLGYEANSKRLFNVGALVAGDPAKRLCVEAVDGDVVRWFDVTAVQSGENTMYYATEADAVVSALDAQRSFVQTFSKTFAQLSIGLAIFDRNRKLILFNPALNELTGLGADFLSKHCDVSAFFDALREQHIVPSPVSHTNWRDQIESVLKAAMEGHYSQTWTLPSGLTYRVTGRPHPDGALAFLFEDITAEITVTRRFRSELEHCHNVLDTVPSALVLFAPNGHLHLCNRAYRELWKSDPESTFAEYTLRDALAHWEANCLPTKVWTTLKEKILSTVDREPWHATVTSQDLTGLRVTLTPIAGGLSLVSFSNVLPLSKPKFSLGKIDQKV